MTTRSICISAAVLLLALTLTWPAFPGQSNTNHIGSQSTGAGTGKVTFSPFTVTKETDVSLPVRESSGDKFPDADVKANPQTAACSDARYCSVGYRS